MNSDVIILKEIFHREKYQIGAFFPYNAALVKLCKEAGMAYSNTYKCWYAENTRENYFKIKNTFDGKTVLDETKLKAAFTARKGKSDKSNKQTLQEKITRVKSGIKGKELFMMLDDEKRNKIMKFKEWMKQKRYSDSTIDTYSEAIIIFFAHYRDKSIESITNEDIVQFNIDYILARKLSFSYQNQFVNAVKLFFREIMHGRLDAEIIERPRREYKLPNVLSKEEVSAILKAPANIKHKNYA